MVSHARTHYSSLLPSSAPPIPVSAVLSHSLHAPTPTRCRGGRGWIYTSRCRPRASLRLGTRLQCEKTTSKKTLKPGVEVPTSSSGAFFSERRDADDLFLRFGRTVCLEAPTTTDRSHRSLQPSSLSPGPSGKTTTKLVVNSLELVRVSLCL